VRVSGTEAYSIIVLDKFILATRDSGYKGTESALAELVDNSLQAGALRVAITISADGVGLNPMRVAVQDDGCGMDRMTLRQALRFGGSSRFNDRAGMGRYGMGLPNSSLSQARHLDVYSWQHREPPIHSYLDVDEITDGRLTVVPNPRLSPLPPWSGKPKSPNGTLVVWTCCDRLDHRRVSTIVRRLAEPLGRVFRYFLWNGAQITVNGAAIDPIDPLYCHPRSARRGGRIFGKSIEYEVEARSSEGIATSTGKVIVTFAELPVEAWHDLSNDEKRRLGIANGAGVSVVRANREIDYGWFFMGGKRRENYDDWWRCEVRFDPILDEAFGITHTKQQIRPEEYVQEILTPDLETTAKALNARVRNAHMQLRQADRTVAVERLASERDEQLKPLPRAASADQSALMDAIAKRHPAIRDTLANGDGQGLQYRIVQQELKDTSFFSFGLKDGLLVLALNPEHPFYGKVYKPLMDDESDQARATRTQIELMLLAAARAEATASRDSQREALAQFRRTWSDNLATFLSK
jgi:hypothetical protein